MIGQDKTIQLIRTWRMNKSVPRFIILEGDVGSGRLTLAKIIIKQINAIGVICGNTIADVRQTIENAYTVTSTTCYIFRDCDDMSIAAKNSLLKVVEEPPTNVYFIMTIKSVTNMLSTILSRATIVKVQPYTLNQLKEVTDDELILKYATNIGQAKEYEHALLARTEIVCNDIYEALRNKKGVHILKHSTNLLAKETEEDKIPCSLFLKVFETNLPLDIITSHTLYILAACKIEQKRATVNKKASIECMLIHMLEDLKNDAEVSETMG